MADPMSVSETELEQLSQGDRDIIAARVEVELDLLRGEVCRRVGGKAPPTKHRLTGGRMREIVEAAKQPGFSLLSIPLDEWAVLCAGGQLEQVTNAMSEVVQ